MGKWAKLSDLQGKRLSNSVLEDNPAEDELFNIGGMKVSKADALELLSNIGPGSGLGLGAMKGLGALGMVKGNPELLKMLTKGAEQNAIKEGVFQRAGLEDTLPNRRKFMQRVVPNIPVNASPGNLPISDNWADALMKQQSTLPGMESNGIDVGMKYAGGNTPIPPQSRPNQTDYTKNFDIRNLQNDVNAGHTLPTNWDNTAQNLKGLPVQTRLDFPDTNKFTGITQQLPVGPSFNEGRFKQGEMTLNDAQKWPENRPRTEGPSFINTPFGVGQPSPNREALLNLQIASDPETVTHTARAANIGHQIATLMGKLPEEAAAFSDDMVTHDLGKMGIPGSVLHDKGAFWPEAKEAMNNHPVWGSELLGGNNTALGHQRYYNNSTKGYPVMDGEMTQAEQLAGVADVFDALGAERSYKKPFPLYPDPNDQKKQSVMGILRGDRSKQFSPSVIDALNKRPDLIEEMYRQIQLSQEK